MYSNFEIEMQHTEESLVALSHMQYNLFCGKDRFLRTVISFVLVIGGIVSFANWWGILLVAYGCYLTTSTYLSANRTAHKLSDQIKASGAPFPHSRYVFKNSGMEIYHAKERQKEDMVGYEDIFRVGEDMKYFYLFRDQYGGYMIPKDKLDGRQEDFRRFIEMKTGKGVQSSAVPIVRLYNWIRRRIQQ
ncbi:MAG: YcxB family protein [Lachnospiraceae bacterium]|nr:YcxB family protein [Lachnospiraceae bacterium]